MEPWTIQISLTYENAIAYTIAHTIVQAIVHAIVQAIAHANVHAIVHAITQIIAYVITHALLKPLIMVLLMPSSNVYRPFYLLCHYSCYSVSYGWQPLVMCLTQMIHLELTGTEST